MANNGSGFLGFSGVCKLLIKIMCNNWLFKDCIIFLGISSQRVEMHNSRHSNGPAHCNQQKAGP